MPAKQELVEILGYASKPLRRLCLRRENSISRQQRLWFEETRFEWTTIEAEGRYAVEIERARLLAIFTTQLDARWSTCSHRLLDRIVLGKTGGQRVESFVICQVFQFCCPISCCV